MRVVFVSIFYPVFMGGYLLHALQKRTDIELFTIGPYTGDWIPWGGGMQVKHRFTPDLAMPPQVIPLQPPVSFVEPKLPWKPDLWIQVDAGFHLDGKPTHGRNFIVGTDPHCLNYDPARGLADKFFCMQRCYAKPGDVYLPYGYDPEWHRPEPQARAYDACLIGLHYPTRDRWVAELRRRGHSVCYTIGPAYEEARRLYAQSCVGLNWSSMQDLNARAFELLAYGVPAVMNTVTDMPEFFEAGRDYIAFSDLAGAVAGVEWLLEHPTEAQAMAERGRKTVEPHTWDARVDEVLSWARW